MEASQEIMRQCVFISCWHHDKKQSRQMWDAYTSTPDSVVISTSAKALSAFVPGSIVKSLVKYHTDDFARTEFDHLTLFFYKPRFYSFERELRMLLTSDAIGLDEIGRHLPVNLKKIVHRVITHPRASPEFKTKVDLVMKGPLKHLHREDSTLLP